MKVVWLGGSFLADASHFASLAGKLDALRVYGATLKLPQYPYRPAPPEECGSRLFSPVGLRRRGHLWWLYPGLLSALDEDQPDVVHVLSEPWGLLPGQALRWLRRHPEVALVIHGCDRLWWHGPAVEQAVRRRLARRALDRADGFVAETPLAVERARQAGLARGAVTGVVHTNPRDPAVFRPAGSRAGQSAERGMLGLPRTGAGVGFIGRLVPEKGALVFLDAVARLRAAGADRTWFAMAGIGPLEREARARCAELGVTFLGQLANPEQAAPFFRAIDVLAVPSYTTRSWDDQSPRVVIEAMLSGCVVVGSRCGAIPEMLGENGVVVEEHDPESLAAGIESAIERARDSRGRTAAREEAMRRYSPASVADQLAATWEEALGRRRGALGIRTPSCAEDSMAHASEPSPRVLVTSGALVQQGRANLGDVAQAEESVRRLRAVLPGAAIAFMSNAPTETYDGPTPLIRTHIDYLARPFEARALRRLPVRVSAFWRAALLVWNARRVARGRPRRLLNRAGQDALCTLRSADALYLSGSGGFADLYMFGVVAVWSTLVLSMRALGKPIVLSGQQIGPLEKRRTRVLARRVLSSADLVGVRDPRSARVARSLGIEPARVVLTGDDAWDLPAAPPNDVDRLLDRLGVAGEFIAVQFRLAPSTGWNEQDIPQVAAMLDRLSETTGLPLVFVSMMHAPPDVGDPRSNDLLRRSTRASSVCIESALSPQLTKGVLGRARFAVGVSNHFAVFAAGAGTPTLAVHRTPYLEHKFTGLAALHPGLVAAVNWTERNDAAALSDALRNLREDERHVTAAAATTAPTAAAERLAGLLRASREQPGREQP